MEGFDYVNMTNCSYLFLLMIEDLKLCMYFIDALPSMVGYWSNMYSYGIMSALVVEMTCYWLFLMV